MTLFLAIATPTEVVVPRAAVRVVRAEDASGSFGIMAGHADLLTMLGETVLRWSSGDGPTRFCAVARGLLVVSGGSDVRVSARRAIIGERLETLTGAIARFREDEADRIRHERVAATRLHSEAVRRLVEHLRASGEPAP